MSVSTKVRDGKESDGGLNSVAKITLGDFLWDVLGAGATWIATVLLFIAIDGLNVWHLLYLLVTCNSIECVVSTPNTTLWMNVYGIYAVLGFGIWAYINAVWEKTGNTWHYPWWVDPGHVLIPALIGAVCLIFSFVGHCCKYSTRITAGIHPESLHLLLQFIGWLIALACTYAFCYGATLRTHQRFCIIPRSVISN